MNETQCPEENMYSLKMCIDRPETNDQTLTRS